MYRIIVAGGRDFDDYQLLSKTLDEVLSPLEIHASIMSGGARGADALGEKYASEHNIPVDCFPANWRKHGRSAGFLRNKIMAANANALVAFWDGTSPGTKHMIDTARSRGLAVHLVNY